MDLSSYIDQIGTIPLFSGLSEEQLQELATIVLEQVFRRGQTIFLEGDEGSGFYVVKTGKVKIFKLSADGKEQILHIFGPGEPFAEVPVLPASVFRPMPRPWKKAAFFSFPGPVFWI